MTDSHKFFTRILMSLYGILLHISPLILKSCYNIITLLSMHAGKAGWCSYLSVFSLRGAIYHRYGGLLLNILLSNVPIRSLVLKLNFKKVAGMMLAFNPSSYHD